ncbi:MULTISPECIES: TIGR01777 family oxidoreductase [unclassified Curtobacterium]|uniref:TIGR01777 family oxidoreductase n=1 Tax=unclassified Curtobacterium TaxID=257496 RepID=UPI0008DC6BBE|nr:MULTISPECIES: TIGR01777 family oxidoreductase [unclassified Curtobacterium]OIH98905.1 TIGR01777 family protein [Curtobacterium sp. MCBA15_003]OII31194.1 TIGR01777 family protein [Curtobacterium sp. MMLR14_006]
MADTAAAPLSILVAGASGFIGTPLVHALREAGHDVTTLVRREPRTAAEFRWAPGRRPLDPAVLDGADVVINLAGANIGKLPWTDAYRDEIRRSRVDATDTLVEAMRHAAVPPALFLSGSASGVYGDRPADVLHDDAAPGTGFLADVCTAWEAAANAAPDGVRVVTLRTGIVVGQGGGALAPLVPLTKAGLGGRLGTGGQFWPWIALEDEVGAIVHLATSPAAAGVTGPVNLAGPDAAVADRLTKRVAEDLHRPYLFHVPAFALRFALRDAADDMLLSSQQMVPTKLLDSGYAFRYARAEDAVDAAF